MKELKKVLTSNHVIRFSDCDSFQHLHNTRYIDYFLHAREYQIINEYDLNPYELFHTKKVGWVVVENSIKYFKPARIMEEVIVETTLIDWGPKYVLIEMLMWDIDKKVLKSILWTKFVHISVQTQKAIDHSEELQDLFRAIVKPIQASTLDERITDFQA